ncbi:uncharacterized protein TNIN_26011 [Trichonephila inaurata madagascariensis]|uniref:Uncharacterized protein n=1 Tax=Trichonephila inaurata madagascariensis TaxID=2747483 RepID=A0A8X6XJZ6_9ARAC|nr:uncharacterized protein TNIN_26011 [Trichonephila inaurata madagascariensis]
MTEFILPPQLNKRLISTLMSSRNSDSDKKNFVLKSSSEFANRSENVFGELQVLEKHHETWISKNKTISVFEEPDNIDVMQNAESKQRRKTFPLFKRKSQRWIRYSLKDTPLSSDATNTAVALQFIDEIRKRKEQKVDITENSEKIMFKKPTNLKKRPSKAISAIGSLFDKSSNEMTKTSVGDRPKNVHIELSHLQEDKCD